MVFSNLCASNTSNILFNVYRNNENIGYHKVEINRGQENTTANVEINFKVKFLGFTLYDYFHINSEQWNKNRLQSLNASTDKNGKILKCESKQVSNGLIPTSYWNHILVEGKKNKSVLNTQDCSLIYLNIKNLGPDTIYNSKLMATRYKLTGKESNGEYLDIDIWYDENLEWVKMRFLKDGSVINYILDGYDEK
tara:strand:- start:22 stop:603 length:582 start_codon:yes stop_codon:yes gene_type:complete